MKRKDTMRDILTGTLMALTMFGTSFAWLFYGKDVLRWLFTYGATIAWTVAALVAVTAVVVGAVKLTARLNRPKRYGTIPAELIRTIMK